VRFDLASQLYQFEWELRDKLTAWSQTPVTAVTLLGGAMFYLVEQSSEVGASGVHLYRLLLVLGLLGWCLSCVGMVCFFVGYTYEKVPRLPNLLAHYEVLKQHYASEGGERAGEEFESYLMQQMAVAVDINAQNNARKSRWLNVAGMSVSSTLLFTALAAGVLLYFK